jgi:hypothetical protein
VSKIVERMAMAICESVGPEGSADAQSHMGDWPAWHDWIPLARAALRSVKPEDISDEMLEAFYAMKNAHPEHRECLRRALAAAIAAGA